MGSLGDKLILCTVSLAQCCVLIEMLQYSRAYSLAPQPECTTLTDLSDTSDVLSHID